MILEELKLNLHKKLVVFDKIEKWENAVERFLFNVEYYIK